MIILKKQDNREINQLLNKKLYILLNINSINITFFIRILHLKKKTFIYKYFVI